MDVIMEIYQLIKYGLGVCVLCNFNECLINQTDVDGVVCVCVRVHVCGCVWGWPIARETLMSYAPSMTGVVPTDSVTPVYPSPCLVSWAVKIECPWPKRPTAALFGQQTCNACLTYSRPHWHPALFVFDPVPYVTSPLASPVRIRQRALHAGPQCHIDT